MPELLTTRQVADERRCSLRTIRRMIDEGDLVAEQKLPGSTGAYLFHPAEVARAFAATQRGSRPRRNRASALEGAA